MRLRGAEAGLAAIAGRALSSCFCVSGSQNIVRIAVARQRVWPLFVVICFVVF